MQIFLIILGLIFLSSAKWSIKRGRGGKRTRDGILHFLLGILFLSGGLIGLVGEVGFFIVLILVVVFKTPLGLATKNYLERIFRLISTTNKVTQSSESTNTEQKQVKNLTKKSLTDLSSLDFSTTEVLHDFVPEIQLNDDHKTIAYIPQVDR